MRGMPVLAAVFVFSVPLAAVAQDHHATMQADDLKWSAPAAYAVVREERCSGGLRWQRAVESGCEHGQDPGAQKRQPLEQEPEVVAHGCQHRVDGVPC